MMARYLIVGGVAGGASAAARLRRLDEKAEIILFERGDHISYASCGLPYYIGDIITKRDKLFVQKPEGFGRRFNMDVRVGTEVLSINTENKTVHARNLATGEEYDEEYDKLLLSPGAEPIRPPIPGINHPAIFTMRNVPDTDRIREFVDEKKPRRAVVVGAGFIGLEMAENLHKRGIFVTIVEMARQVMTPLDFEMAAAVHQHLKMHHVEFYLDDAVASFEDRDNLVVTRTKKGRALVADLVILSIGVKPENRLAKEAGLPVGPRGGIVVNNYLQTSNPDIYAVGDAIEFPHPLTGKGACVYLAGPATKQGRAAADNIALGNSRTYEGAYGAAVAKVFDLTVATVGLPEKALREEGIPCLTATIHTPHHAGYYPGSHPMSVKIVFSPDGGRLLGAQIVGRDGVDKRIDVLSALMRKGGSIWDLTEMEHAYAPPYSSSKDPVNIAGFVAENLISGLDRQAGWEDVQNIISGNVFLLDVRMEKELKGGIIPGSVNIPLDSLRERMEEIPRDRPVIVYCAVGLRGYLARRILVQHGFEDVRNLAGGYQTYETATMKQGNEDLFEKTCVGPDDMMYRCEV